MGRDLARSLGHMKGDSIFVISPRGSLAPVGFVPYMKRFEVVDFFQTGMYEYDGSLAFVRMDNAQTLAHVKNAASAVDIRIDQIFRARLVKERWASVIPPSYRILDLDAIE